MLCFDNGISKLENLYDKVIRGMCNNVRQTHFCEVQKGQERIQERRWHYRIWKSFLFQGIKIPLVSTTFSKHFGGRWKERKTTLSNLLKC